MIAATAGAALGASLPRALADYRRRRKAGREHRAYLRHRDRFDRRR